MAKEITGYVKLQCKGGQANPAPPIGPALGSKGVNIMEFCKQFNARTQDKMGKVLPVLLTVYSDKSFDFIIKTPPAAVQLKDAAKIRGSKEPNRQRLVSLHGTVEELAKIKGDRSFNLKGCPRWRTARSRDQRRRCPQTSSKGRKLTT